MDSGAGAGVVGEIEVGTDCVDEMRAGSLAPLEKSRGFGMTPAHFVRVQTDLTAGESKAPPSRGKREKNGAPRIRTRIELPGDEVR